MILCPNCCNSDITHISYGTPSLNDNRLIAQIEAGNVVLGGCVINEDSPAYFCKNCKCRFGNYVKDILKKRHQQR